MKKLLLIASLMALSFGSYAQSISKDFAPVCDSLDVLIKKRHSINHGKLKIKSIMKRGDVLDFYFTESLGDFPWREGEPQWFRDDLRSRFPEKYRKYKLGSIFSKQLKLELGHSHPIFFDETDLVTFDVPDSNTIIVKCIDKQLCGQIAAEIRSKRPPEPYLGKGIKYSDEKIRRKAGKAGK